MAEVGSNIALVAIEIKLPILAWSMWVSRDLSNDID